VGAVRRDGAPVRKKHQKCFPDTSHTPNWEGTGRLLQRGKSTNARGPKKGPFYEQEKKNVKRTEVTLPRIDRARTHLHLRGAH